ncbi:MAG: DUF262 domain-containing HNH endonuclease family protein [Kiritimatiellae bacterium]|nr:DUF262 domain-containing HNH endonuclease family protein [Kiritimatiellia bacterium]
MLKFGEFIGTQSRLFVVPTYQRAYAWGEKQWKQFLEDLQESQGDYYLGHFLVETANGEDGSSVYGLIDGQQRVTTSIIFMKAVIDALSCSSEREVKALRHKLITTYIREDEYSQYRFRTVDYDRECFNRYILEGENRKIPGKTTSENAFVDALEYFRKKLKELPDAEVCNLATRLNSALITEYEVKDRAMAAQIFSFQNDRGKDLSKLEILKAFFLLQVYKEGENRKSQNEIDESVRQNFASIYQLIAQVDIAEDSILAAYWRSRIGFYSDDIISSIKKVLKGSSNKGIWIKNFSRELSDAFQSVKSFRDNTTDIAIRLRTLGMLDLVYPFVIRMGHLSVDEKTEERMLRSLENLIFRVKLCARRANVDTDARLGNVLKELYESKNVDRAIEGIKNGIREWGYWSDSDVRWKLDQSDFYNNAVDEYLLWQYERSMRTVGYNAPSDIKTEVVSPSIEHIAPQTPTNNDPIAAGYGAYEDVDNKEKGIVTGGWMNALGNLVLLSLKHNIKVSNHPFDDKIKEYEELGLLRQQMEIKDFASIDKARNGRVWDVDAIAKRHTKIIDWAMKYWSVDTL